MIANHYQSRFLLGYGRCVSTLDIAPLRSLVAVAAAGGFHRAAATLHLTQSAVSQLSLIHI